MIFAQGGVWFLSRRITFFEVGSSAEYSGILNIIFMKERIVVGIFLFEIVISEMFIYFLHLKMKKTYSGHKLITFRCSYHHIP